MTKISSLIQTEISAEFATVSPSREELSLKDATRPVSEALTLQTNLPTRLLHPCLSLKFALEVFQEPADLLEGPLRSEIPFTMDTLRMTVSHLTRRNSIVLSRSPRTQTTSSVMETASLMTTMAPQLRGAGLRRQLEAPSSQTKRYVEETPVMMSRS